MYQRSCYGGESDEHPIRLVHLNMEHAGDHRYHGATVLRMESEGTHKHDVGRRAYCRDCFWVHM